MAQHSDTIMQQGVEVGTAVVRLSHTDCTAAALTETITLATLRAAHPNGIAGDVPASAMITHVWVNLIEEFSGGTVATAVIDVGEVGLDVDELVAAQDVFTGAGAGIKIGAGAFTLDTYAAAAYVGQVIVTTTVAFVDQLTAGEAEICIRYEAITLNTLAG